MAEPLTLDTLMDALAQWRETLPGDTAIAFAIDDDVDDEPEAHRVLVLWPYLPEVRHA